MPEKRNSDEGAWSLNDEDTAIVYMCGVDWQHHTLADADGTLVYGSERALRRKRACVDECGIVRGVWIRSGFPGLWQAAAGND